MIVEKRVHVSVCVWSFPCFFPPELFAIKLPFFSLSCYVCVFLQPQGIVFLCSFCLLLPCFFPSELFARTLLFFLLLLSRSCYLGFLCSQGHSLLVLLLPIAQTTRLSNDKIRIYQYSKEAASMKRHHSFNTRCSLNRRQKG